MLSQKEFVENCYNWYREADLQPGNPEDGNWDAAHYPIPSCKDGTETILLLREHHAIQGVIQSEELQWKCLWGWEEKYLTGEYLELYKKWKSEGSRLQWEVLPTEEKILRSEKARARALVQNAQMSEEKKILKAEKLRARYAQLTEEEKTLRAERARAKALAQHARRREREAQELLARWKQGVVRW